MTWKWLAICLVVLAACGGTDDTPVPTQLDPEQALEEAGLPSQEEHFATQTAQVPTPTIYHSPTPTATLTDTPTLLPTDTVSPTATVTLSVIQETEAYLIARQTDVAGTATALTYPTATPTLTLSPTLPPTLTPTASDTPEPTLVLPPRPPANRIIFVSDRLGNADIWLMGLDGSSPEPLVLTQNSTESTPSCSHLGTQFVFTTNRNDDREIYLGSFDGSPPRPLTDTVGENYDPVWSPLSDQIAFVSTRDGTPALWMMDSGGGNVQNLVTGGEIATPQWSPDGSQIYYVAQAGTNVDIFAYDLTIGQAFQVTNTLEVNEAMPSLGYDLFTLAYIANLEPQNAATGALWLTSPAAAPRAVVTAQGRVDTPTWIDNGKLLLSADLGGVVHILFIDLNATKQSILTNLGPMNLYPRPCYVAGAAESALPTGVPVTPTPTPTPDLTSDFTAVVNPGGDWQTVTLELTLEELQAIAPTDYRLGGATASLEGETLIYTWTDEVGNVHRLSVTLADVAGALEAQLSLYTVNDNPAPLDGVQDLSFVIAENILLKRLPPGAYHLQTIIFEENVVLFTFNIPS